MKLALASLMMLVACAVPRVQAQTAPAPAPQVFAPITITQSQYQALQQEFATTPMAWVASNTVLALLQRLEKEAQASKDTSGNTPSVPK